MLNSQHTKRGILNKDNIEELKNIQIMPNVRLSNIANVKLHLFQASQNGSTKMEQAKQK